MKKRIEMARRGGRADAGRRGVQQDDNSGGAAPEAAAVQRGPTAIDTIGTGRGRS